MPNIIAKIRQLQRVQQHELIPTSTHPKLEVAD